MRNRPILCCLAGILISLSVQAQHQDEIIRFNFGFEELEGVYPKGWLWESGVEVERNISHSGKHSLYIGNNNTISAGRKLAIFYLSENYEGHKITVSAYIKTENITEGVAGLFISLYPVADNTENGLGLSGSNDWTLWETTMQLDPKNTEYIGVGPILTGKGHMWVDDITVKIDGQEVYERVVLPADKDHEFDNGSKIEFPNKLTKKQISDLELLGKKWGWLKYNNPQIAAGNYNWDYELFRFLPEYLKNEDRVRKLLEWEQKYSKTSGVKSGKHHYVRLHSGFGNPIFLNENTYSEMPYPDAGFRLLALFRHWSAVNYFYPEKHLTDKNWDDVLREYIPIFISAESELEYELATLRLIGEVCDSHAGLWAGGDKIDSLRGNFYNRKFQMYNL